MAKGEVCFCKADYLCDLKNLNVGFTVNLFGWDRGMACLAKMLPNASREEGEGGEVGRWLLYNAGEVS